MYVTVAGGLSSLATGTLLDGVDAEHQRAILATLSATAALTGVATALLMRLQVDPSPSQPRGAGLAAFARVLRDARARTYLVYQLSWGAAIAPAASYWTYHVLGTLGLGFKFLAAHGVITALVRIATVTSWGRAVDRFGARPVLAVCSMGIGFMPLLWIGATPDRVWPLLLDAVLAGSLWGGHGVAAIDLPLAVAPRRERPYYVAAFATAGGVGFAASAALASAGAGLAPRELAGGITPFHVLFVASGAARFACGVYALRLADAKGGSLRALASAMIAGAPGVPAFVRPRVEPNEVRRPRPPA
jgi:hypothetical protein